MNSERGSICELEIIYEWEYFEFHDQSNRSERFLSLNYLFIMGKCENMEFIGQS